MFLYLDLFKKNDELKIKRVINYWKYILKYVDVNNYSDYQANLEKINSNKYLKQSISFDHYVLSSLMYSFTENNKNIEPVTKLISPYGLCNTYYLGNNNNFEFREYIMEF